MPYAVSDELRIHYEVHGFGRPIVLAHGWGASTATNWVQSGWVDALSPGRQVIGVDIRGHGRSDKPYEAARYSYAAMAGDVLAVMDDLGVGSADFLGYSLGSFSGACLLGHQTDRLTSAVLIGIGDETIESIAVAEVIASALRAPDLADIDDAVARTYRQYVDMDPMNDREALAVSALQMWPEGFPRDLGGPGLASVDIPVLVLNGSDDVPYVRTDEQLVSAIPTAELVRIAGCDHLAGVWDQRFKDAVMGFLDR